jgi:hypothetical protein
VELFRKWDWAQESEKNARKEKKVKSKSILPRVLAVVALLAALGMSLAFRPLRVIAVEGETVVIVEGNPSCADLNADDSNFPGIMSDFGFKIQNDYNRTVTLTSDNGELTGGAPEDPHNTVTVTSTDNIYFDWLATLGMDAVIVKGGPDGNVYVYTPEAFQGFGLHSPPRGDGSIPALSHIEFCYDYEYELDVTKTAEGTYDERHEWDVEKTVDPDSQSAFAGDTATFDWTITVTETVVEENYAVSGDIIIDNPTSIDVDFSVDDTMNGVMANVDCDPGTAGYQSFGTVPAGGSVTCTYVATEADGVTGSETLNTAIVTSLTEGVAGGNAEAAVTWTATVINDSATLDDDQYPYIDEPVYDGWTNTYTRDYTCSSDTGLYASGGTYQHTEYNLAELYNGAVWLDDDDASTVIDCYVPSISKTAAGTYDETHTWTVEKTVTPELQSAFAGDTVTFDWTITVDETVVEGSFAVAGTITVNNPNPEDELVVPLSDVLSDGTPGVIDQTSCNFDGTNLTVAAGGSETCDYDATPTDRTATFNTATIMLNNIPFSDDDPIEWTPNVINDSATLDDDQYPYIDEPVYDGWTNTYTRDYTCSSDTGLYASGGTYQHTEYNLAELYNGAVWLDDDDASTVIDCYVPVVEKDAETEWFKEYIWEITKSVDPGSHTGFAGDSFASTYTVIVDQTIIQYGYRAFGTITVSNPNPEDELVIPLTDVLSDNTPGVIDPNSCNFDGTYLTVAAGGMEICSYSADLNDTTNLVNTATATLNGIDFEATADVIFGDPIIVGYPTINVYDYFDVAPGEWLGSASGYKTFVYTRPFVCPAGDSGLYTNGVYNAPFPNTAEIDETGQQGNANVDLTCYLYWAFTPGFWKTHASDSASGNDAWQYTAVLEGDLLVAWFPAAGEYGDLGTYNMLNALRAMRGGRGDRGAAEILLRAGIAALLNASFHEMGGHPIGPDGVFPYTSAEIQTMVNDALLTHDRQTMLDLAYDLDTINNGWHYIDWDDPYSLP